MVNAVQLIIYITDEAGLEWYKNKKLKCGQIWLA